MTERTVAYIALGSNVGNRQSHLAEARRAIAAFPLTRLVKESAVEETDPIGPVRQGPFLNQMIVVETALEAEDLLRRLQQVELGAGRIRGEKWGPRTLDLDIVTIEGREIESATLVVPHPELPNRDFWLRELASLRRSP